MARKYNIDDLKYVESLKFKKQIIAYYDEKIEKYVDINSNTNVYYNNIRTYKKEEVEVICDFNKMLSYNSIWILLLDANGKKHTEVTAEVVNNLKLIFEKISSWDISLIKEINYICHLVTNICVNNLFLSQNKAMKNNEYSNVIMGSVKSNLDDKLEKKLDQLLFSYIFIDTAINRITERKLIIRKENNLIDYKILRILKYLEIDINVEDIPNFKIEYNLEGINYYDSKGNKTIEENISREEVEKIKKLVDKRRI